MGLPRQLGRIANGADGDTITVDREVFAIAVDAAGEDPVHAVVLEQMGIDRAVAKVVDGHHLQLLAVVLAVERAEHVAADAAKTVDCDADSHRRGLYLVLLF
ncbi:hypothetical protein D3C80_1415700 [compost metagenome]